MKILLVKPRWFVHGGQYRYLERVRFTPLSLGILASPVIDWLMAG